MNKKSKKVKVEIPLFLPLDSKTKIIWPDKGSLVSGKTKRTIEYGKTSFCKFYRWEKRVSLPCSFEVKIILKEP